MGMFFFPNDEFKTIQAKKMLEVIVEKEGLEFLGWREVPTEPDKLSKSQRLYAMHHAVLCKKT